MKHVIKHDLDMDLVKKATHHAMDAYAARFAKYDPEANWNTETNATIRFTAKGVTLEGTLDLRPKEIELQLDVPFVFKMFQKKAVGIIDSEITEWLGKARRGELDDEEG
jgi:hypothetical protein